MQEINIASTQPIKQDTHAIRLINKKKKNRVYNITVWKSPVHYIHLHE